MAVDSSLIGTTATAPLAPRLTWPEHVSGFVRAKPQGAVGAVIILAMLAVALLAHALAPYDPYLADYAAQFSRPGAEHWFGTDEFADHAGRAEHPIIRVPADVILIRGEAHSARPLISIC